MHLLTALSQPPLAELMLGYFSVAKPHVASWYQLIMYDTISDPFVSLEKSGHGPAICCHPAHASEQSDPRHSQQTPDSL